MNRFEVRWTRRALRRLDQIGERIAADNPAAAARVVKRIVTAVDSLAEHPALGRAGRIKGTRDLVLADIPYNRSLPSPPNPSRRHHGHARGPTMARRPMTALVAVDHDAPARAAAEGERAAIRILEFFASHIRNLNTRGLMVV